MIKLIVAVDRKWGIGRENGLLFKLPADMEFFRRETLGKTVVYGGNTLRSFPNAKPLPKRENIVLSRNEKPLGAVAVTSLDELKKELLKRESADIYICGGASVYAELLDYCSEALVTKVDADGNAAVFFPDLDAAENWRLGEISAPSETNGYTIQFAKYINERIKSL